MAMLCNICGHENAEHQFDAVEVGQTVMYCVCDLCIIGFATVTNKEVIENALIRNGEIQSKEVDHKRSFITAVPYGCKRTNTSGAFKLHIGEFMILSPDEEGINEQMKYTINRCQQTYAF